ncbi:MAG: phosphatase PAP2 family protein [Ruminococcus sp.]|nr:phosphatase PAP2 family protein [Ruminococcus sp.]
MGFFELITPTDTAILDFIQQNIKCVFLDVIMVFFSYIGEIGAIWLVSAIAFMFSRKTRLMGIMVICAVTLGFLLGEIGIKNIICRPRPFVTNPDVILNIFPPLGYSCPSGHSCSSLAAATVIFAKNKRYGIPALCVALLIVFSRLYNYVHYPSDVLFGMMLGVVSAFIIIFIFNKAGLDNKLSNQRNKKKVC